MAASSGERPVTYWRYWSVTKKKPNAARNWTRMVSEPAREAADPEQPRVQQRVRACAAPRARTRATAAAPTSSAPQERVGPAALRAFDDAEHDRRHRHQGQHAAHDVQPVRRVAGFRDDRQHAHEGDRCEGHVEPEERGPREPLEQQPGREQAQDRAAAGDATQTPMARGRSASGKRVVMTDSVVGMIAAAPTPISIRTTISWPGSLSSRPSAAAARRRRPARPASSSRRPNRSPSAPASSSSPAKTTV